MNHPPAAQRRPAPAPKKAAKRPLRLSLALLLAVLTLAAGGCIPRRRLAYFQSLTGGDTAFNPPSRPYFLQPGDVLTVRYSGPDPAALVPFGTEGSAMQGGAAGGVNNAQIFMNGHSVSDSGTIYLPLLGNFQVAGQTVDQVEHVIQARLNQFVRNSVAKVRLVSFKISVLGEVRSPGTIYIYNERLTLPEALGYAGDLTDAADRRHVRLIRRRQGRVSVINLDMTDRHLLGSPNFYLEPNDVLYVEPLRQKADRLNLPAISIGLSALTTVLVLINLIAK